MTFNQPFTKALQINLKLSYNVILPGFSSAHCSLLILWSSYSVSVWAKIHRLISALPRPLKYTNLYDGIVLIVQYCVMLFSANWLSQFLLVVWWLQMPTAWFYTRNADKSIVLDYSSVQIQVLYVHVLQYIILYTHQPVKTPWHAEFFLISLSVSLILNPIASWSHALIGT